MDIIIPTLELAVVNAVNLLTRSRMKRGGPFYLVKPISPLNVHIERWSTDDNSATVMVESSSWGHSMLTLTLGKHNGVWLPWGTFTIVYTNDYPYPSDSIRAGKVSKEMFPAYVHRPHSARMFELCIRSSVRSGR